MVTQGCRDSNQRVTAFRMARRVEVECGRAFKSNKDSNTKEERFFKKQVRQYVRILPQKWHAHMSMRMAALEWEAGVHL